MAEEVFMSLRPGINLVREAADRITFAWPSGLNRAPVTLSQAEPGLWAALERLREPGLPADRSAELYQLAKRDGLRAVGRFVRLLQQLSAARALCYTVRVGGRPFAVLLPTSGDFRLQQAPSDPQQPYLLSRFACLRRDDAVLALESPLGYGRLLLPDSRAAALVIHLTAPHSLADLRAVTPGVQTDSLAAFLRLLLSAAALTPVDAAGQSAEAANPHLAGWEFHDLLFHTHSRLGRQPGIQGSTYRFIGKIEPLPALPPARAGALTPLPKPDIAHLMEHDVPFTAVLEGRRSRRDHAAEAPISLTQLGEFLYRAARVREVKEYTVRKGAAAAQVETSSRVYPGGGALYALDIYLTVATCAGLASGFYYYDPREHALEKLAELTPAAGNLLRDARCGAGVDTDAAFPQLLINFAARFQRLTWKYEGLAYALILKDVGALIGTMYLVAEALGLAGCALGSGNSDLFSRLLGEDYYFTTSVGEFALGSRGSATGEQLTDDRAPSWNDNN